MAFRSQNIYGHMGDVIVRNFTELIPMGANIEVRFGRTHYIAYG